MKVIDLVSSHSAQTFITAVSAANIEKFISIGADYKIFEVNGGNII